MDHVLILLDAAALVIGIWAIVYTQQIYRIYKRAFLKSLAHYAVFLNLAVLVSLAARYLWTNLFGGDPQTASLFMALMALTVFTAGVGRAYSFTKVVFWLRDKEPPRIVSQMLGIAALPFFISYIYGWRQFVEQGSARWIGSTSLVLSLSATAVIIASLVVLWTRKPAGLSPGRKKSINGFVILFLTSYAALASVYLLPRSVSAYVSSPMILWLSLLPLIWLKGYFEKNEVSVYSQESSETLELIAGEFKISKREREIMELVLQGKRNKDIENLLYISGSTVKNHIYNLYQKVGVKSRVQLIQLVMRNERESLTAEAPR
jgi:DNA-binding CsgD family transcriptional regulator